MAYTSRELNRLTTGIKCMNVVKFCSIAQQLQVKTAMEKCFDSTEMVYAFDNNQLHSKCEYNCSN